MKETTYTSIVQKQKYVSGVDRKPRSVYRVNIIYKMYVSSIAHPPISVYLECVSRRCLGHNLTYDEDLS